MRHAKHVFKIGKTGSHRKCMLANMLKSLIEHERIETSIAKAKELRKHADKMITLAKKDTLATRRRAISKLQITFNPLSAKQARKAKKREDSSFFNGDRKVIQKLFGSLKDRYESRQGGYTRIIQSQEHLGDGSQQCLIEFVE